MSGWIRIHRQFLNWEWFNKSEAVHLFMYLVLKANHKDGFWQGNEIKRGQLITSFGKISIDTNISLQTIRTLLKKFEKTNEINMQTTNKFTRITICKYDSYQTENEETNTKATNKQQTTNTQLTTNKNVKNNKEIILDSWIDYRKQIKKPIKDATIQSILNKMENYSEDQCKHVINNSIQNGYQGLFWENLPTNNLEPEMDALAKHLFEHNAKFGGKIN
jgi:DNA-binding transcriptional MerR regulator